MSEPHHVEHGPGIGFLAAGLEVFAVGLGDVDEFVFRHGVPREGETGGAQGAGGRRERGKVKGGDDAVVGASAAAEGAEEVGVVFGVDVTGDYFAVGFDGEDVDGGNEIDGEALEAG